MSPLPSKLLVMKVKLYQIIEDTSAELHSLHSVNGSWFKLDLRLEMTVQFFDSDVFSIKLSLDYSEAVMKQIQTSGDVERLVSISSDSILKPSGRILCLVRAGISNQISSLHFFKNQFCRRRDFLA